MTTDAIYKAKIDNSAAFLNEKCYVYEESYTDDMMYRIVIGTYITHNIALSAAERTANDIVYCCKTLTVDDIFIERDHETLLFSVVIWARVI